MKSKLYKSLVGSMLGAGMLALGSCTDLSERFTARLQVNNMSSRKAITMGSLQPCILLYVTFTGHGTVMRIWTSVQTCGVSHCAWV